MNAKEKQQQDAEMFVFREFAEVCPLPLILDTAENRKPPEPDILCPLKNGDTLAFELGEIADVTSDKAKPGETVAVTRDDNDSEQLCRMLSQAYREALAADKIDRPERFESHNVTVHFQDAARLGKCKSAVPRAIELLNKRDPGRHAINDNEIRAIICEPYSPCSNTGPLFYANSSFMHVENSTVANIKRKLGKSYETSYPIHLLAWSDTASVAESEFWKDDLATLLQNGMSKFDRVWVFSRGERSIVFDSAVDNHPSPNESLRPGLGSPS